MKKDLLYWLLSSRHNLDKSLKKKLFIGLGLVGAFIFVGGIILTYFGFQAAAYLVGKAPSQDQLAGMAVNIKDQSQKVLEGAVQKDCLSEIQAHLSPNVWLTKPISVNIDTIRSACFGPPEIGVTDGA